MANKKSFIKIKEIVVPAEKAGKNNKKSPINIYLVFVSLWIIGLGTFFYFISPRFFQDKPAKIVEVEVEKKIPFIPERIISLDSGIDFPIVSGTVSAILKSKQGQNISLGDELLILGNGMYRKYLIIETEVVTSTPSGKIYVENNNVEINFPISYKPPQSLLLKAENE